MLALNGLGFNAVLTLTEDRIDLRLLSELGIRSMHIPIANMHAPTIDQARRATNFLCDCIYEDKQVFVHCYAGYGRTGAILAAYLVATGSDPLVAINQVRKLRPGAIEGIAQEQFVVDFARSVGRAE